MTVTNGLHANATHEDIHSPIALDFADAAARLAGTFIAADEEKFYRQLDDDSIWMLIDYTGPTFVQVNADFDPASVDLTGNFALSGDISPTSLSASQNNYNPTSLSSATVLRLTSSNDVDITGLQGGADGRII